MLYAAVGAARPGQPVGPSASEPIAAVAFGIAAPVAASAMTPVIVPRGTPGPGGVEKSCSGSEVAK